MNPETKASVEQIKEICRKYGIRYYSHKRITVGFNHEVHRLNDDLILKIYNVRNRDDSKRFKLESAILSSGANILKPRLIASDDSRELIDRDYLIMSFIDGISLGSVWHEGSDEQREKVIRQICDSLRVFNTLSLSEYDISGPRDWEDMISVRFNDYVARLQDKSILDEQTIRKTRDYFDNDSKYLSGSAVYPVHWDVHFDNFIVDDDFNLLALIDLETVQLAALDYPLFTIQTMMNNPDRYLSEENEKNADKKDYENLKLWYQKYYPEMFEFENLERRVSLYVLLDILDMLVDWSHVKRLHVELDKLISNQKLLQK